MQQQIFKDLEILAHKFSKVEQELNLPKNYLSRFKDQKNPLPKKWVDPLIQYIHKYSSPDPKTAPTLPTQLSCENPPSPLATNQPKQNQQQSSLQESIKKVRETMNQCNKDYGNGSVMLLGDGPIKGIDAISTGSITLDEALGIGGLPRGRMVEIFGPESSGKTTIALHVIAQAQKMGLLCMLIDAEHAYDPEYAANIGVDLDHLLVSQPDHGEQALEIADRHILSGNIGVVVIDSVAALIPKAELSGEMGDSKMGLHAKLMSQACRKMTGAISKTNTLCIFINQLRNKIGIVYGSPEVTTGGMALQFYASVRLDVRSMAQIKNGEETMGRRTKVKVIKNKVSPPFKVAEFDIIFGKGISKSGEIVDLALEKGIILKSGSWFKYGQENIGQGRESVKELIENNPEFSSEIQEKLKQTD